MHVPGDWSARVGGRALFENRLSFPDMDWLSVPRDWYNKLSTYTKKTARTTLGRLTITIHSVGQTSGKLDIGLNGNPTRTLAHLLARFGEREDFATHISSIHPVAFFEMDTVGVDPRAGEAEASLDRNDNWIPDPAAARRLLGEDVFATFLPIYVRQLQLMVTILIQDGEDVETAGTVILLSTNQSTVRVRWGEADLPQVESYFERYHGNALSSVRYGAFALLAADHTVGVHRYPSDIDLDRDNDSFSITIPLTNVRSLKVYAKTGERIRFEVLRHGKGDYSAVARSLHPHDRLVDILESEREHARLIRDWRGIGELFGGPDQANFGDLDHMATSILSCFPDDAITGGRVLMLLLEEGAISPSQVDQHAIERLVRKGLVQRNPVRRRDKSGRSTRYSLRAPYRDIHQIVTGALRPRSVEPNRRRRLVRPPVDDA